MGISSFRDASLAETPLFVAAKRLQALRGSAQLNPRELFDIHAAFG